MNILTRILILYGVTVIGSYAVDLSIVFSVLEDLVAAGFKLDMNNKRQIFKLIKNKLNTNRLEKFIFFKNIKEASEKIYNFSSYEIDLFQDLIKSGLVLELGELSKKESKLDRSILNIIRISTSKKKENAVKKLRFVKELSDGSIVTYLINDDKIVILNAEGPVSKMSVKKQEQYIRYEHDLDANEETLLNTLQEMFETPEDLFAALEENRQLTLNRIFSKVFKTENELECEREVSMFDDYFVNEVRRLVQELDEKQKIFATPQKENDFIENLDDFYKQQDDFLTKIDEQIETVSKKIFNGKEETKKFVRVREK